MASSSCSNFCKHEFRRYHLSLDYVSPYDFITFQCGCHRLYVAWRIFWALYHSVWIVLTGVYSYQWAGDDPSQQVKWFIYLTDWAYTLLTFSSIFDSICVVFISMKKEDIVQDICPIMPWYLKVDWVLFNISNTSSVLISILYWGLVHSSSEPMTAVNIETHALNSVYVIVNLLMSGIPVRFYHFFHPMIFCVIYIVFSVIYQVSGGTNHNNKNYIYSVMDWDNTTHTVMIALIVVLVAVPIIHFVMFLLHLLRLYFNKKCCSRHKQRCTIVTPVAHNSINSNDRHKMQKENREVKISVDIERTQNLYIDESHPDANKKVEILYDLVEEEGLDAYELDSKTKIITEDENSDENSDKNSDENSDENSESSSSKDDDQEEMTKDSVESSKDEVDQDDQKVSEQKVETSKDKTYGNIVDVIKISDDKESIS